MFEGPRSFTVVQMVTRGVLRCFRVVSGPAQVGKLSKTPRKRTFPAGRNSPDHPGWPTRGGRINKFLENHDFH